MQLGTGHIWRMRLLEVLLRAAIAEGSRWGVALATAKCLTPFYRSIYPKVGPLMSMWVQSGFIPVAALLSFLDAKGEL